MSKNKLTFSYYLRECAKTKGFDFDLMDRTNRLIIIVLLLPVYFLGKHILRKGGNDIDQNITQGH